MNPKADKLLQDLAALNLISIQQTPTDGFMSVVNRLRAKATPRAPTLDEITKEIKAVRTKRYARKKA